VIDGRVAFCGGINILDDYHDPHHGRLNEPRLDFAVRASGAHWCSQAHETMAQLWWRMQTACATCGPIIFPMPSRTLRSGGLNLPWKPRARGRGDTPGRKVARATLLLRDNVLNRSRIERAYRRAIADATQEIIIANAYFLPGRRLRRALIHAARRGVKVRLLLQGRYEYFMQFHAARPVYGPLMDAGVEIHEYTASFLHAKVAVIDAGTARALGHGRLLEPRPLEPAAGARSPTWWFSDPVPLPRTCARAWSTRWTMAAGRWQRRSTRTGRCCNGSKKRLALGLDAPGAVSDRQALLMRSPGGPGRRQSPPPPHPPPSPPPSPPVISAVAVMRTSAPGASASQRIAAPGAAARVAAVGLIAKAAREWPVSCPARTSAAGL
jgi:hypothetical protein